MIHLHWKDKLERTPTCALCVGGEPRSRRIYVRALDHRRDRVAQLQFSATAWNLVVGKVARADLAEILFGWLRFEPPRDEDLVTISWNGDGYSVKREDLRNV